MNSEILIKLSEEGNNIDEYLNRYEGDEETCELLTGMFANDEHTVAYFNAYYEHDLSKCRDHMNSIKSSVSNIGLTLLASKAKEIMHAIDNGNFSIIDQLNDEYRMVYDREIEIITMD